jgi:hypothetical protein
MAVETPHFALPFVLRHDGANAAEQDSLDDIANCVVVILSTYIGTRDFVPAFGVPDLAFQNMPFGVDEIKTLVESQEPRAIATLDEDTSTSDHLVNLINVGLDQVEKGGLG